MQGLLRPEVKRHHTEFCYGVTSYGLAPAHIWLFGGRGTLEEPPAVERRALSLWPTKEFEASPALNGWREKNLCCFACQVVLYECGIEKLLCGLHREIVRMVMNWPIDTRSWSMIPSSLPLQMQVRTGCAEPHFFVFVFKQRHKGIPQLGFRGMCDHLGGRGPN